MCEALGLTPPTMKHRARKKMSHVFHHGLFMLAQDILK